MFQTMSRTGREMLQVVRTRQEAERALNLRDLRLTPMAPLFRNSD
jgi:hypothetical protein